MRNSTLSSGKNSISNLIAKLRRILPADSLLFDPAALAASSVDALRGFRGFPAFAQTIRTPLVVIRPKATQEVQAVLRFSRRHRIPVVPFGGGSGLMGGAASIRVSHPIAVPGAKRRGPQV